MDYVLLRLQAFIQKQLNENPTIHINTGMGCLVAHRDIETGKDLPPCIRCGKCLKFIRPEHMSDACNGIHNPLEYHK